MSRATTILGRARGAQWWQTDILENLVKDIRLVENFADPMSHYTIKPEDLADARAACEELLTNRDIATEQPLINAQLLALATQFADDTADFDRAHMHARACEEQMYQLDVTMYGNH